MTPGVPGSWPRQVSPYVARERLLERISGHEAGARIELVAGAGGGKTVLATDWATRWRGPVVWLSLGSRHADPQAMASALCAAARRIQSGVDLAAQELLARLGGAQDHGREALWALAADVPEDQAWAWIVDGIETLPEGAAAAVLLDVFLDALPECHGILLSGRQRPVGTGWRKARLEGRVTEIGGGDLQFTRAEIAELASALGRSGDATAIERVWRRTSGWPLGVSLALRGDAERLASDLEGYLVDEVLSGLPDETAVLLETLAPLERIPPSLVLGLGARATAARMADLVQLGLLLPPAGDDAFVLPEALREVLLARLDARGAREAACRALLTLLLEAGLDDEAYRLARAVGDRELAVTLLARLAPGWLAEGHWHRARTELEALEATGSEPSVALRWLRAELARAEGRYPEALRALDKAETCHDALPPWPALLLVARAGVHLETVEPLAAAAALDRAQQLAGEGGLSTALQLARAENALNLGMPGEAAAILAGMDGETPEVRLVRARLALRTGRLAEASRLLPSVAVLSGRGGHRNPALLDALVGALTGRETEALERAEAVIAAAERAASPVTRVVALTRAGHALAALARGREAAARYEEALRMVARLGVPRLGAEAELGLGMLAGQRDAALVRIDRAAELGRQTGDAWFEALAATAAALVDPGDDRREAAMLLADRVGDPWLAGLPASGGAGWLRTPSREASLGGARPGLMIRTFGGLVVQREGQAIPSKAWTRDKARQLLAVLAAHPDEVLPKVRLIDLLWPDMEPEQADGTFRVVLNALQRIVEPERAAKTEPRFIRREGPGYRLADAPDVEVDIRSLGRLLEQALSLPDDDPALLPLLARIPSWAPGPFLPEMLLDEPWCDRLRDQFETTLVAAGLRWARLAWQAEDMAMAGAAAAFLVGRDPALEEAWRLWMAVQARLGERSLALRTWDRCVAAMARELDAVPERATEELAEAIRAGRPLPDPWVA
ncbi:MAG: BTAD domain-containing putative transcriptional regulator [Candidatus Sericytochromatia bacterium]|nr:BTAD domain-containing putative transcriptional regulator [Candidatus Sericytochromatia bacterium]